MSDELKYGILAGIGLLIIIVIILIAKNVKKTNIKKQIDEINVRFNTIKTIPLAFKLNKAQAMAKRNEDTVDKVNSYYERYKEVSKHIEKTNELMEDIEDNFASRDYKEASKLILEITNNLNDLENEVNSIDEFLEQFSKQENADREYSANLKEKYRELKLRITENAKYFSIAYEGIEKKLDECEELFSTSEEWMYANDYDKAEEALDKINERIKNMVASIPEIPALIKDGKGVIPYLFDEVTRQYELARQRGLYLEHLQMEQRVNAVKEDINFINRSLLAADTTGLKEKIENAKTELNSILENLEIESKDFGEAKTIYEQLNINVKEIKEIYRYISTALEKENNRFDLTELKERIKNIKNKIDDYNTNIIDYNEIINSNSKAASEIKKDLNELFTKSETDRLKLLEDKALIDKNTNDEKRARTHLIKLQVVLNEVEVKVNEYHLPSISPNYIDDLKIGREKINQLKIELEEIPLNIELLNETLNDAIDYVYTFYNNVNNVVGMAVMVENAIVFGNKYRSTYPSVDRDLSNAEFSYLNGEYTKALTIAINCMDSLFPNKVNEKILENS